MEALALAKAAAEAMWREDNAARWLGMRIEEVRPGCARLSMPVAQDMVNGHNLCHGGLIFTLADTAFAYACNSYNQRAVAAGCSIEFLAPAYLGEVLTAECSEQVLRGRTGVYDVKVTNQKNELIAVFRGKSATIKGQLVEGA
ncbi:MAG: hydroxyphenylacetyl-CoA thioesterase PaaI [Proteobacteria bacterium]|nr:hydroxyphenylacetyl-CoA thioesterase PaaI [Pseudomonadota bacterium]